MADYKMPILGADMDEGTIVEWRVAPGDRVSRGDIVAVVDTDKSTIEAEVFEDGVIEEILVPEGERVPVGTPLARLAPSPGSPAEEVPEVAPPAPEPPRAAAAGGAAPQVTSPMVRHLADQLGVDLESLHGTGVGGSVTRADVERAARPAVPPPAPEGPLRPAAAEGVRASPRARRVAQRLGISLDEVPGTGPGGAVMTQDVERMGRAPEGAPAPGPAAPPPSETEKGAVPGKRVAGDGAGRQESMRRAIASLMTRSKKEIPHYYLSTRVDLSAAASWLESANLERPVSERLVMSALLLKATALAATEVPEMNGYWRDGSFDPRTSVDLGVAVSLRGGGLLAPALRRAESLELGELMARLKDLVARARRGALRSSEMSDPTITVTNLGDMGVESVLGVIYPPQVAMVGFGKVAEQPWASQGMLAVRPVVTATLAADHRASDGHRGGLFLTAVDALLQKPEEL